MDSPHLAARYPSLLTGDRKKQSTWNKTTSLRGVGKTGLRYNLIESCRLEKQDWLSRPVWFWTEISKLEAIREVHEPWSAEQGDLVFCEDVSRFLPRAETVEFVADVLSPFSRRFVVNRSSCKNSKLVQNLRGVVYEPKVRFAM